MKKGISPLIAAVILIAFVIAVAGVASDFFTGFFKKRQSEISEKGETVVECGVANLNIQEDILSCSAPNWESMVARWHLDEGSGTTAYDSSKNSNDGTLLDANSTNADGDDPPNWVNGKFGKALEFDGTDDYVEVDKQILDSDSSVTISAWMKPKSYDSPDYMVTLENTPSGDMFELHNRDGNLRFYYYDGAVHGVTTGTQVPLNEWSHVVVTFNPKTGEWKYYLDGSLDATTTDDVSTGSIDYSTIGTKTSLMNYFDGKIDEVRIYDKALSQSQIEYLYSHGTSLRFSILNKGQTSLGKKFGVSAIINGTSLSGSVSLDNSLDKAEIQTVTALKNISTAGKLEKVRVSSKACGSVYDSVEPDGVYC